MSSCFFFDLFLTWFETVEQATVVLQLLHLHSVCEIVRIVCVPSFRYSLETWEC